MLARTLSHGPSSAADPNEGRSFAGAFGVSAFFHALAAGLLVFLTVVVGERPKPEQKTFELVKGPGDDFMAAEAPAGDPGGKAAVGEISFNAPAVPVMTLPAPAPAEDIASPEPPAAAPPPVTPVAPVPPPAKKAEPPVPNFKNQINRKLQQEKRKAEKEIQRQRAQEARDAKERGLADKRMTHEEFQRSQGGRPGGSPSRAPAQSSGAGAPGSRLDPNAVKRGVLGGTGANSAGAGGSALSAAAEGAAMERYFSMLRSRLRENHEKPGGLSDLLNAEVQFTIAADGSISGVRIARSSGNPDFDQSVLEAFARVRMPARPDGKTEGMRLVFRMKEADGR